jgi:hypothetical protein
MRLLNLLALLLFAIPALAGDLANVILSGKTFGEDWELTQPNLMGKSAAPSYINRKLPNQPMVMVNIIGFATPDAARAQWERKFGTPEAATLAKKVEGMPDAFDNVPPPEMKDFPHLKRFMLIGRYWLTVEQTGSKDYRKVFIEKYYETIKKLAEQSRTGQPATRSQSKSEGGDKPQPEAEGRSR